MNQGQMEYVGLGRIEGPLIVVENVYDVGFDEEFDEEEDFFEDEEEAD